MSRDLRYDISTLFDLAFGVKSPVFVPYPIEIRRKNEINIELPEATPQSELTGYDSIVVKDRGEPEVERVSMFGTEVSFPMSFKEGTYKFFDDNGQVLNKSMSDFELPITSMADFTRSKILAESDQSSGEGNIVEMYGFGPWQIRIRGLCLYDRSAKLKTVKEQKNMLLQWEKLADKVAVGGELFAEKGITHMVCRVINIKQLEGRPYVVPFEIDGFSMLSPLRQGGTDE